MKYITILFVLDTLIGNTNKKISTVRVIVHLKMYKRIRIHASTEPHSIISIIVCKKPSHFCDLVLFYIIEKSHKMVTNNEGYYTPTNLKTKEDQRLLHVAWSKLP